MGKNHLGINRHRVYSAELRQATWWVKITLGSTDTECTVLSYFKLQWWLRGSTPKTFERDERERVLSSFIEGKFNPSKSPAPRTQHLARTQPLARAQPLAIARSTYCSSRNYREARSFEGSSGITDPWRQSWFLIEDQPNEDGAIQLL